MLEMAEDSWGILKKRSGEVNPDFGCNPLERPLDEYIRLGMVNLDKPPGPTSHQVTSWVKDIVGISKAGHSGTLDPKVTGVLPIAFSDATKILTLLLRSGKEYVTLMRLHGEATNSDIKRVLSMFQAEIIQRPPIKSAVKRVLRKRTIHRIQIIESANRSVLFSVDCDAGTYIRKLCHDIGLVIGCGAHMAELRRVRSGPFTEESIVSMHDLKDAFEFYREDGDESHIRGVVQPVEAAVSDLKKIWVDDTAVSSIAHGASLKMPGVSRLHDGIIKNELVALMSLKDELIAVGAARMTSQEISDAKRGEAAVLKRVVMSPELYPRQWKSKL